MGLENGNKRGRRTTMKAIPSLVTITHRNEHRGETITEWAFRIVVFLVGIFLFVGAMSPFVFEEVFKFYFLRATGVRAVWSGVLGPLGLFLLFWALFVGPKKLWPLPSPSSKETKELKEQVGEEIEIRSPYSILFGVGVLMVFLLLWHMIHRRDPKSRENFKG